MANNFVTKKGNLLKEVTSGIIIHGCNSKGSFNKGFARQVREQYPLCYEQYFQAYFDGKLQLGKVIWYKHNDDLFVANGITQEKYGNEKDTVYADYTAIQKVFHVVFKGASLTENKTLQQVHFPMIGAGLAKGNWNVIHKIITKELEQFPTVKATLWVL